MKKTQLARKVVIAVDPGGTCGVAVAGFPLGDGPGGPYVPETFEFDPMECVEHVELWTPRATLVVCESFKPRPGARTWQPDALYTIGAIRYITWKYGVPFELQSPADAKSFATNEKLKKVRWRAPSRGGHGDDALRHLLLAAVRHKLIDPEELL